MIVYGDPQWPAQAGDILTWARGWLTRLDPNDCDAVRAALIQAGQFEQAIADADQTYPVESSLAQSIQALTNALAALFLAIGERQFEPAVDGKGSSAQQARLAFHALVTSLTSDPRLGDRSFTVKVPEGFAFYALFPEQYTSAAWLWLTERKNLKTKVALVLGVRSIGTTLSAVVISTLGQAGWKADRITVRPTGHPFQRTLHLQNQLTRGISQFLVVDEGPGLSGSSMAAVAIALEQLGVERSAISFFPGHPGDPGTAATLDVRQYWSSIRRYVLPSASLAWSKDQLSSRHTGAGLLKDSENWLIGQSERLFRKPSQVARIDDLSGGLWRQFAYPSEADWPAVAARFEHAKYLVTAESGERMFWKFNGLGALLMPDIAAEPGAQSISSSTALSVLPFIRNAHGFVAMPWIEGRRLTRADADDPTVIESLAAYLRSSAGCPMSSAEQESSRARLVEMAVQNIQETFGLAQAKGVRSLAACIPVVEPCSSYTDGRLAPQEWVRSASGHLVKTDHFGHVVDHTVIGRQSWLWDVAGCLVEWELDDQRRTQLLTRASANLTLVASPTLTFYELAYTAFRLGLFALCLGAEENPAEARRLDRVCRKYQMHLAGLLGRL